MHETAVATEPAACPDALQQYHTPAWAAPRASAACARCALERCAAKLDVPPCPGVGEDATVQASIAPGKKPACATVRPKNFGALQKVPAVGSGGPKTDAAVNFKCWTQGLRAIIHSLHIIRSRGQYAYASL